MKTLSRIRTKAGITQSSFLSWVLFNVSVAALYCMVSSAIAYAGQVTLGWDQSTESDVAGYKIYYGTATGNYTQSINITSPNITTCTIINLTDGQTYYFAATAYNTELLESDYSEEVFTTIKSITVTWPNGGTVLNIGTTQTITWNAEEITNNLRIVLFQDGEKVGNIVDSIAPNIGTYSWTVGQFVDGTATAGTGYQIQVREIGIDVGDRSDAIFTLTGP